MKQVEHKLSIPDIGDKLTLTRDWTFDLWAERRNVTVAEHFGYIELWYKGGTWVPVSLVGPHPDWRHKSYDSWRENAIPCALEKVSVTIPADSVLTVDRIYIRKGAKEFSSISFYLALPGVKKKLRFWAKLNDCNQIVYSSQ